MESRRSRKRPMRFVVILVILLALVAVAVYYTAMMTTIRTSYEFRANRVDYLFYDQTSDNFYLMRFITSSKLGYIIKIPGKGFYIKTSKSLDPNNLEVTLVTIEEFLELSKDASFYAKVDAETLKFLRQIAGHPGGFVEVIKSLTTRGIKLMDYLKANFYASRFRMSSNMSGAAFLKLLDRLHNSGIQEFEIRGITKRPVTIVVGDKKYERIYLEDEDVERVRNLLK